MTLRLDPVLAGHGNAIEAQFGQAIRFRGHDRARRRINESYALFADQLAALEADSRAFRTQGDELDVALLLDGLSVERERGITIDVAYRHFSTDRGHFIVADAPSHERNDVHADVRVWRGVADALSRVVLGGVETSSPRRSAAGCCAGVKGC